MKTYTLITLILFGLATHAQIRFNTENAPDRNFYWVDFGGGGSLDYPIYSNSSVTANANFGSDVYSFSCEAFEHGMYEFVFTDPFVRPSMRTFSLKYGKIFKQKKTYFILSTGLGWGLHRKIHYDFTNVFRYGAPGPEKRTREISIVTVPLEAKFGIHASKVVTLYGAFGGHLNEDFPQIYLRFGIGFGRF